MMFHQEAEGFVKSSFTPLFGRKEWSVFVKKVKGKKQESKSSNILFQIEFADPVKGGIVSWASQCRLKHLGSEQYLTLEVLEGQGKHPVYYLELTEHPTEKTLFTFVPVDKGGNFIGYGSLFRIKHVSTGKFLRVETTVIQKQMMIMFLI